MKKTLLILMLLPLCALAQNASELLVRWEGTRMGWSAPTNVPVYYYNNASGTLSAPSDISSANISGQNVNFNNEDQYTGYFSKDWPTTATIDYTKYVQVVIKAGSGKKIEMKHFKFRYDGHVDAYKIIYQKTSTGSAPGDTSFGTAGTVLKTATSAKNLNNNDISCPFAAGTFVNAGETMYIRVYGYSSNPNDNKWFFKQNGQNNESPNTGSSGPALYGVVSAMGGVTAVENSVTTLQNTPVNINVLANDTANGTTFGAVTIDTAPSPSTGTAAVQADKTITFTPANNYTGSASFKYKIAGADGSSGTAFVYVTVNPFVAPTAGNISASVTENASVTINVLGSVTMGSSNTVSQLTASTPAHGSTSITADNKVLYTPATSYYGNDSFTYTVKDSNNKTATATVSVTVNELARPVANNDTATTGQNIAVTVNALANDTAGAGTINSITITGQPANGTATVNGSNNIVYTPSSTFTGTNTITYKITDTNGKFATATITVTVQAIIAVSAVNDNATTAKNTPITVSVLDNDTIGNSALTAMVITVQASHGSAVVNGNNTITYTPANNYTGSDSFKYKITNAYGTSSTATVSMMVLPPSASGALCGTYVISAVQQADYPQFATISAAVTHLNQHGITCPVTFLLKDDVYNNASGESFPLTINNFSGSSVNNTVTFKPAPYKNVRIEAFRDPVTGSYTGVPAILKLNGADNIVIDGSNTTNGTTRNLTLVNSSFAGGEDHSNDYTDRAVIWIGTPDGGNGCENITVKYTGIKQTWKNTSDNFCVGIYAGHGNVNSQNEITIEEAYAAHKNINITGNDFTNVKQGVYVNGNAGVPTQNIVIRQNDLGSENNTETIILPVSLNDVDGFDVSENYVYNLVRDNSASNLMAAGVYVTGITKNGIIQKNDFKNLSRNVANSLTFAAIVLASETTESNITVVNNFILNVSALGNGGGYSNGYGIIADTGGSYKIYHNTISLNTNQPQGGYSAALYVNSSVTKLDVRNNIFANNQSNTNTRRSAIMVNNDVDNIHTIFTHLDYNNYYSADRIGYIANIHSINITWIDNPDFVTTLQGWKAALANSSNTTSTGNRDVHSVSHNTVFVSASDLHLAEGNSAIDNEGIFIATVTKDIDGQLRNTVKPTIGADEYGDLEWPAENGETNPGIYCATSTKYKNGVWSNGEPTAEKDAIFASDYTQTGGTMYACSIYVIGAAKVNFISHSAAVVTHAVNVATGASLTFESGSSLRQIENTANTGNVVIKRNSSFLKRLDYTLWSSPVKNEKLLAFSPATMTDRFYIYNTGTDQYNAINSSLVATTNFTTAKGYLIRMPNSNSTAGYNAGTTAILYQGKFTGTPHNGTVRIPLTYGRYTNGAPDANGTLKQYNAIGNPYASPINITDFLTENSSAIDGTIYLWRKTNDYTKSSYWTCNKSGSVANAAPGGVNDLVNYPHAIDPTGLLNTGQGFIVKALEPNREVVFKNNMRRSNTYDNFFRSPNQVDELEVPSQAGIPNASRIWLNVENSTGTFAQTMLAYTEIATMGYDNGYDGETLLDGGVNFYSLMPEYKLAIQSRPAFTATDVVPLGFKTTLAGTFVVKIDHVDGLFSEGQPVYLKDNVTGTMHNLVNGSYSFTSETGTFDNRFEIHYSNDSALGTDKPVIPGKDIVIYSNEKQVKIKSADTIESVSVFDILGKLVYEKKNIGADEFSTSTLATAQQVLVVKVTLTGGRAVSKKIMMN